MIKTETSVSLKEKNKLMVEIKNYQQYIKEGNAFRDYYQMKVDTLTEKLNQGSD